MPSSAEPARSTPWLELKLAGPERTAPELALCLEAQGFAGWVVNRESPLRWTAYLPQVEGWQGRLAELTEQLSALGARLSPGASVKDEDWAENWKRYYHAFNVGETLVVRPSWEEYSPRSGEKVVVLDPGSAFGTGYHATTRLCLELLEQTATVGSVLDFGTGSGILAIAALLLGACRVVACDRDPLAVKVAQENLCINRVSDRSEVLLRDRPPEGSFDLVLANLTADLLLGLHQPLVQAVAPGGHLILGGIIEERADEVAGCFARTGLSAKVRRAQEGWVGLAWERPA